MPCPARTRAGTSRQPDPSLPELVQARDAVSAQPLPGPGVPGGAGVGAEPAALGVQERTKLHAAQLTRHDGPEVLTSPLPGTGLAHRLQAGRRVETLSRPEPSGSSSGRVPSLNEQGVGGVPLPSVVREGPPGGLGDQPTPAQPVRGTVLLRRKPMCFVRVEAEVSEVLAALVAQQTVGVLVKDAVPAAAVVVTDLHMLHIRRLRGGCLAPRKSTMLLGTLTVCPSANASPASS